MPPGSDIHAVRNGYVSITPLGFDLTDWEVLKRFKAKVPL
jgi:broad specificity polyphosphatase/5'/3'-nucleotidase SurE